MAETFEQAFARIHGKPVTAGRSGSSALQQWTEAIAAEMEKRPGITRSQAAMAVNKKNPGLRQRVLAEAR